ncbi:MAG: ABC transporter permease, partial [Bacilli bacterium]|nr:ABC transporter permease [Bacilli bacterium]
KYYTTYNDNERKTTELKTFSKNDYKVQAKYNDKDVSLEAEVINDNIYGLKQNMYSYQPKIVIGESTYRTKMGMPEEVEMTLLLSIKNYKEINDALKNKDITFTSKFDYFSPALEMAQAKNLVLAVKILFYGFIALVTLIGVTSVINTINTNINLRRKEFAMLRSVGLTPKGFNKLLFFESLFFGIKSLIYGIPVSMLINILISLSIRNVMDTSIIVPWRSFLICILAVFLIVLMAMNYAAKKIKRENILEALREENI